MPKENQITSVCFDGQVIRSIVHKTFVQTHQNPTDPCQIGPITTSKWHTNHYNVPERKVALSGGSQTMKAQGCGCRALDMGPYSASECPAVWHGCCDLPKLDGPKGRNWGVQSVYLKKKIRQGKVPFALVGKLENRLRFLFKYHPCRGCDLFGEALLDDAGICVCGLQRIHHFRS